MRLAPNDTRKINMMLFNFTSGLDLMLYPRKIQSIAYFIDYLPDGEIKDCLYVSFYKGKGIKEINLTESPVKHKQLKR